MSAKDTIGKAIKEINQKHPLNAQAWALTAIAEAILEKTITQEPPREPPPEPTPYGSPFDTESPTWLANAATPKVRCQSTSPKRRSVSIQCELEYLHPGKWHRATLNWPNS